MAIDTLQALDAIEAMENFIARNRPPEHTAYYEANTTYTEVNQVLENLNHDYFGITETTPSLLSFGVHSNQLCIRKPELFQYKIE